MSRKSLDPNWASRHSTESLSYFIPKYHVRKIADKLAGETLHYTMDFYNHRRSGALKELKARGIRIDE